MYRLLVSSHEISEWSEHSIGYYKPESGSRCKVKILVLLNNLFHPKKLHISYFKSKLLKSCERYNKIFFLQNDQQ